VVLCIDLPADRDIDHLNAEVHRAVGQPPSPKVAHRERGPEPTHDRMPAGRNAALSYDRYPMPDSTTSAPRTPKGRAPQRRDENARRAVLHAADDLLVERGFGGVTIEGIAARAGVAKQTIYRWWPSKVDVLLDTLIADAVAVPDTGSAVDCTRRYLRTLARFLTKEPAGKVLLALIGEAQHDPEMARTFH